MKKDCDSSQTKLVGEKGENAMTAKTYDRQTAKFLAVVGENMPELSGEVMQGWIENPKSVQRVLCSAFCPPEAAPEFKIWKTIKLGTGLKTADDFHKALKTGGFRIGDWANDILGKPSFERSVATVETEAELVVLTTAQLTGNVNGGTTGEVFAGAKRLGLNKCPAELGPQLRLQYLDQAKGEWLLIGMEPIADSGGQLLLFSVGRGDRGLWLDGRFGGSGDFWCAGGRWVFLRRK